jgi:hypothetical protein
MVPSYPTRDACLGSSAEQARFADRTKVCGREIGSRVEGTSLLTIRLKEDPVPGKKRGCQCGASGKLHRHGLCNKSYVRTMMIMTMTGSCFVTGRVRNELTATETSIAQKKRRDRGA